MNAHDEDWLNFVFSPQGTPALFLILLLYDSSLLTAYIEDERSVHCLIQCSMLTPVVWFGPSLDRSVVALSLNLKRPHTNW